MNIGIQLYSAKAKIEELGLDEVLKRLSEMGIDTVETAGFYGLSPEEMKEALDKHGLSAHSAHIRAELIEGQMEYIDAIGFKKVIIPIAPIYRYSAEEYADLLVIIKRVQEKLTERGIAFGYHNHYQEYQNGGDLVLKLMNDVPGLKSQLDIFWATVAGRDPVELINSYGERMLSLHVKELGEKFEGEPRGGLLHAVVGEGYSKCRESIAAAKALGVDTYILEVESNIGDHDFWDYVKRSIENIKKFVKEA